MEREEQPDSLFKVGLDENSRPNMRTAAIWAMVTGIAGFISLLFICISSIDTLTTLSRYSMYSRTNLYFTIFLIVMILFTVISFLINFYLVRFGSMTRQGIDREEGEVVDEGLKQLNSYIKILGICLIIFIVLIVFVFLQKL